MSIKSRPKFYRPIRGDQEQVLQEFTDLLEAGREYLKFFGPKHPFGSDLLTFLGVLQTYRGLLESQIVP